jgi:hypothetical protein
MGRIIGDTAIVLITLGGTLRMTGLQPWWMPDNWVSTLRNTGSTLTSYILYTSPAGEGNSTDVSFGASFVLVAVILLLNGIAALAGSPGTRQGLGDRARSRNRATRADDPDIELSPGGSLVDADMLLNECNPEAGMMQADAGKTDPAGRIRTLGGEGGSDL